MILHAYFDLQIVSFVVQRLLKRERKKKRAQKGEIKLSLYQSEITLE